MTHEELPPPVTHDRPFPWPCVECKAKEVFPLATDYTTTIKHDGRSYSIKVPGLEIPTCRKCGHQIFGGKEDDEIRDALRACIGLLTSKEIKIHRAKLGLSQLKMAELLGVAKETICRWESGAIQSRPLDNLLRLFFASEEVRRLLEERFAPQPTSDRVSPCLLQMTLSPELHIPDEVREKESFVLPEFSGN